MTTAAPVRVVHFNTNDVVGGAAKAAARLHEALRDHGVASRMVVLNRGGNDPDVKRVGRAGKRLEASLLVRDAAHKAVQYTVRPSESFDFDLAAFSAPTPALLDEARTADVLHLHWIRGLVSSGQLRKMAATSGAPVVWTLMDLAPIAGGCHYPGTCTRFEASCGSCPVIGSARAYDASRRTWARRRRAFRQTPITVVACTRWVARYASSSALLEGVECVTIPLTVDTTLFRPGDVRLARTVLGLPHDALIVFCGAQQFKAPRKGLREFVDALGHLRARLDAAPDVRDRVLVVTAGAYDPSELPLGFPHVHLGHLGDDRILALAHQAADVFLSPSLEDAGPMILNEALSCGTPAAAFDTGGAREWLDDGNAGVVAELGDVARLGAGLAELLLDDARRADAGRCARTLAVELFSPAHVAARYAELYETLRVRGAR